MDNYYGYVQIFTDGSKQPDTGKVAIAYVIPEFDIKFSARVSDHLSVFSAELIAIVMALQWVEQSKPIRVAICSDSLSKHYSGKRFMMCRKFNRERVFMKRKIEGSGESFILRELLSKGSDHRVIKYMLAFLKNTGLIDRI